MTIHTLPPVSFSVTHDMFNRASPQVETIKKFARQFFTYLIFPVALLEYALKRTLLPGRTSQSIEQLDLVRDWYFERINDYTRTTVETIDKVKLDTVQFNHPTSQKWIVYLNPNNGCYENNLPYLASLFAATGQNIYTGNYRGTGRSEGDIVTLRDLLLDGDAFIQDLLSRGVALEDITLHGHSMGGGVGAELAVLHSGVNLAADRTYASIEDAIGTIPRIATGSPCIGHITSFIGKIATQLGWNLDPLTAFPKVKGRKIAIYHKVCFLQPCGLYTKLKAAGLRPSPAQRIKMRDQVWGNANEAHCKPLEGAALLAYVAFVNQ